MKQAKHIAFQLTLFVVISAFCNAQTDSTYAEKLGFPKNAKVVILHVDDMGMSFDSNEGGLEAITQGMANSCSVMMPCPWVPGIVNYLKENPDIDAGVHLTLTSEWKNYRWSSVSGSKTTPGLSDPDGYLWTKVTDVVKNASADEVETEIKAQIDKALCMGFQPTHLDSHMGTLFASPAFMQRYLKTGIEYRIPVMFPGGHNTLISKQMKSSLQELQMIQGMGKMLWNAGLPVLDDLFNDSYGWNLPSAVKATDRNLRKYKTQQYINTLKSLKPGITMVIMHCTNTSEIFRHISDSGPTRKGDLLAMTDPALRKFIEDEGIILTTWKELKQKRDALNSK